MPVPTHTITSREAVYDAEISPLMAKIIALCKKHDIPLVASFQLDGRGPDEELPNFVCRTTLVPRDACSQMLAASVALQPHDPEPWMITTHHADGSTTMTAFIE